MNHAQARGQSAQSNALQAVLQFLLESGYQSTAELLQKEAGVEYDVDALIDMPARVVTALSSYDDQRTGAFKKREIDPELLTVTRWMGSLRESKETYASSPSLSLQTHAANVICCKFQPRADSTLFAAGAADKFVAICDTNQQGAVLRRVQASGPVLCLHFNPARPELVLATCMNGGHSIVHVEREVNAAAAAEASPAGALVHSAIEHKKFVVAGKWSPDGRHYVTGSHDGSVNVYGAGDADFTWKQVGRHEFLARDNSAAVVEALEWLDERSFVVSLREDNYLRVLTLQDNGAADALPETMRINVNETGDDHVSFTILDLRLSPNGLGILCATDRHRVILLARPVALPDVASPPTVVGVHVRNFYTMIVNDGYSTPRLAWSPCGRFAYVTSQDRALIVLEIPSGRSVHRITGHEINVRDVATHPTTGQVLSCGFDKTCRMFDAAPAAAGASAAAAASS